MRTSGCRIAGLVVFVSLLMPGCGSDSDKSPSSAYRCVSQYNACVCGDPAQVVLTGTDASSCPNTVPEGPSRCCKGADGCRCLPYACLGGVTNTCTCQFAVNPVKPNRCLTVAQKAAEQSTDPAAGDHCCASLADDAGQCRCTSADCSATEKEVSLCSVGTANVACPAGETEVQSCAP